MFIIRIIYFEGKNALNFTFFVSFFVLFQHYNILLQVWFMYVVFVLGPLAEENFFEWEALIS